MQFRKITIRYFNIRHWFTQNSDQMFLPEYTIYSKDYLPEILEKNKKTKNSQHIILCVSSLVTIAMEEINISIIW